MVIWNGSNPTGFCRELIKTNGYMNHCTMFLGAHPPSEDPGYVVITLKVGGVEVGNAAEHAAAVVLGEPKIFRQKTVWSVC